MKKKNVTACILAVAALSIVCVAASIANGSRDKKIKEFTAFFDVQGEEIDEDNEIRELIAQKTGARCIEQWLSGKSAEDAVASFIASGEYTDFISGSTILYEARALVPIDAYWDNYPNIKNFCRQNCGTDSASRTDISIGFRSLVSCMASRRRCCMRVRRSGYRRGAQMGRVSQNPHGGRVF